MKHFKSIRKGAKMLFEAQTAQELFQTLTPPNSNIFQVYCTECLRLKRTIIRIRFVKFWTKSISKPSKQVIIFTVIPRQTWCCCFFPADAIVSQSKVLTICTKPCSGWGGENENLPNALEVSASHCHHSSTMTSLF